MCAISRELSKRQKFEKSQSVLNDATKLAQEISDDTVKGRALMYLAVELNNQGRTNQKAFLINQVLKSKLKIGLVRRETLIEIVRLGHFEEAISYARIDRDSYTLNSISVELAKQGNLVLAESIGLEILQFAERHNCWKTIAQNEYNELGWKKSLQQSTQFKIDEARLFYLKGWADAVSECDVDCVQEALSQLAHDSESVESILQSHALREIFFGAADQKKLDRLNRTLNIQWAIDIAAQFPKTETKSRLSTNLESWLHEIADEDDREQIELWAKQVAKGKITEEEFAIKIKVYK